MLILIEIVLIFPGHFVPVLKSQHRTKPTLLIFYRVLLSTLWDRRAAKVVNDPPVQRAKIAKAFGKKTEWLCKVYQELVLALRHDTCAKANASI